MPSLGKGRRSKVIQALCLTCDEILAEIPADSVLGSGFMQQDLDRKVRYHRSLGHKVEIYEIKPD